MSRITDKPIKPGDRITAFGRTFTVGEIFYQEYWGEREDAPAGSDCWGYDIEFDDVQGRYHHWKQNQDGGYLTRKE